MKPFMKLQNQENADFHWISCRNGKRVRTGVQTGFSVEVSRLHNSEGTEKQKGKAGGEPKQELKQGWGESKVGASRGEGTRTKWEPE